MAAVTWNGDAAIKKIEQEMGRRLDACGILVTNQAKTLLSVEGTAKTAPGRGAGGRFTKGRLIYGANPSRPPDPPHVQTGRLRASMAWEREGLVTRVGTAVNYARPLEMGWIHSAARPFLGRALNEKQAQVTAILSAPMIL